MRKALIPAFLLVVTAIVLGSTVFREQVVNAATTPFQNVVVQNTSTNPIPVQQVGTSTTSVSGTVGIDPSKNTVKLDSAANTVNLDSTDATNLANVESKLDNLNFDSSGNLETNAHTAPTGAVAEQCLDEGAFSGWSMPNDDVLHTLCTDDVYATDLTASAMDDSLEVDFYFNGNLVLSLDGSGFGGQESYQLDLTHPLHFDKITAQCANASTSCNFNLVVLGNSTGN
jgi:hypothetical protein